MTLNIGVLGLGSVFSGPYAALITRLEQEGRVKLAAGYDPDPGKRSAAAARFGIDTSFECAQDLIDRDGLDIVLVLTSMNEHGSLARAALEAGRHVLVEKPMATSVQEATELLEAAAVAPGELVCAPHVALSPTYREMHKRVREGEIGELHLARSRYGWSGPWWGRWFYEQGGGALFDLGVYNLTSLCGFFGSVKRVTAMVGVAVPKRESEGEQVTVRADDNAHIVLDFGNSRFASIATGFTMQKYRSPAVELYGSAGTMQLMGDDWAPNGFEQWTNDRGSWEIVGETDPQWPWTEGLRHLVECVEKGIRTVTRPEHAFHALEVMLAAKRSSEEGRVVEIHSTFPDFDYGVPAAADGDGRGEHDPRS
ncbi:Gfo/Idh/MocA family protein [Streptomyces sp. NPDC002917]|uniref:Gfo/Idh/MocA family protein n=1 Tax=unclassified Streptomyces TaxID=2593676 RepID=UPI002E809B45|nr:Gfo/Idh/MocA family oxidoreductase [Streptomyces sp. NBC_00562]WTC84096.1 Gfo/Idh/MocA family oxidoreductase [Streptomyces sp. NBC_01653]WTD31186.1 Gfo/Idh/MocA family oxidoreductase [Streptomyces sp. NBC_01643]WTD86769.1 Gfo/Idh/MocA family oxidoreductase [Streptomyces sp. NBC_01637]WUC17853.1 Gfo/Idh/MocA family oxidoreductase [Streptomyces sp. NBC_00562]